MKLTFLFSKKFQIFAGAAALALAGCDPVDTEPTNSGESSGGDPGSTGDDPGSTSSEPSTSGAEESTGSSETTSGLEDCELLSSLCENNLPERFSCDGPSPCATLEVDDPELNEFGKGEFAFVNPEAATCIGESLRDAVLGTYSIRVAPGQQYSRDYDLEVLGNGMVVLRSLAQEDKCLDYQDRWEMLAPPEHFEGCLAQEDPRTMLDCLLDAGTGTCMEGDPVCP